MTLINKLKTVNIFFLLKTGIGSAVAILISGSLGLAYSSSAGIITLLTIQNTKRETLLIAFKRVIAFIMATLLSFLVFHSIGYTPIAFGTFVFLFVALCILLGLKDGIAMNAVLMTHFLIEKRMDIPLLLNEIAILFIGMGIGIVINLIMPRYKEQIRAEQNHLEEEMKIALHDMGSMLMDKEACLIQEDRTDRIVQVVDSNVEHKIIDFTNLEDLLESLLKKAYEDAGNTLHTNTKYLVSYLEMRKLQVGVLKEITNNMKHIPVVLRQTYPIAEFMEHIAASFHERNNAEGLLQELDTLQKHYRQEKLPLTREEFEYRATLFQILKELEYFLVLKRNFIRDLEAKNMKSYWT